MATSSKHLVLCSLVLLVLLTVLQLAYSVPLQVEEKVLNSELEKAADSSYDPIETARKLWSDAKRLQRRLRPKRSPVSSQSSQPQPVGLPDNLSISGPKYILDLYKNLTTNPGLQQTTQANTIRSLQTSPDIVPKCNQFNFSIAMINSSEYILKAELHLYMKDPKPFANQGSYLVVIKRIKRDDSTEEGFSNNYIITSKEISPNVAGWQVFKVEHAVQNWVYNGEQNAEFAVHIYPSIQAYQKQEGMLDCSESPVEFVFTKSVPEHEPLLVVYSYDPEVEKIDYQAILSNLGETPTVPSNSVQRKKRQSTENLRPSCGVFPLNITAGDIPPKKRGETVLHPRHYNAGICGGVCQQKFPSTQDLKHAQLVHLLLNRGTFTERHDYSFTQCCAPVRYASLDVLVASNNGNVYINIINNMRILECECLDILNFESR